MSSKLKLFLCFEFFHVKLELRMLNFQIKLLFYGKIKEKYER